MCSARWVEGSASNSIYEFESGYLTWVLSVDIESADAIL